MREQLGLTQAQLASAFGVSRNAPAHAEAGNSMLDGRAAQRFAQMLAASQQALAAVQQPQAEMPEGEITHLMALRKHKLTALQAQLHTIHTRAQQATQLLHTAATLASTDALPAAQIDEMVYQAEKKLQQNGARQQCLLQLQIQALEAEIAVYEAALLAV